MTKTLILALPLLLAGGALSSASAAQIYNPYQVGMMPDQYQGPHGRYASQTGFIRSLNGTPCGIECSQRVQARWGWGPYRP